MFQCIKDNKINCLIYQDEVLGPKLSDYECFQNTFTCSQNTLKVLLKSSYFVLDRQTGMPTP